MNKIVYRFTVKLKEEVETHYVTANDVEQARNGLALHLGVNPSKLRHNNKNIPFIVREKIAKGIKETSPTGKLIEYKITIDATSIVGLVTNTNNSESANSTNENSSIIGTANSNINNSANNIIEESITNKIRKELDSSVTNYNEFRYDIEHLFKENKSIITKYISIYNTMIADNTLSGDSSSLSDTIIKGDRLKVYKVLRHLIIVNGLHDAPYNKTEVSHYFQNKTKDSNDSNLDTVTLLDILDSYITNFNKH